MGDGMVRQGLLRWVNMDFTMANISSSLLSLKIRRKYPYPIFIHSFLEHLYFLSHYSHKPFLHFLYISCTKIDLNE